LTPTPAYGVDRSNGQQSEEDTDCKFAVLSYRELSIVANTL
jgi:hypothetical protein